MDGTYHSNEVNDLDGEELLTALEETSGIIEYIDPEESNTSLIAMYPKDLTNPIHKYNLPA